MTFNVTQSQHDDDQSDFTYVSVSHMSPTGSAISKADNSESV